MSETDDTRGFGWRRRGGAFVVSALLVAAICFGLYVLSRHYADEERSHSTGVEVLFQRKPPERPHQPPPAVAPPLASPLAPARNGDPVLTQMLVCFGPLRNQHPECPHTPPEPSEYNNRERLDVGHGSFSRPAPVDTRGLYTRGEELSGLTPPERCAVLNPAASVKMCAHTYPDPPLPSRTAEEICEAQNMGGPCRPPIPDEPQHVRRTPSTPP